MARSLPRIHRRKDLVRADELGPLLGILLGVEPVDRDLAEVSIGIEPRPVLIRQPFRFNLDLQAFRRLEAKATHVELLDYVEHLQSGQTLRVRSLGVARVAAIF